MIVRIKLRHSRILQRNSEVFRHTNGNGAVRSLPKILDQTGKDVLHFVNHADAFLLLCQITRKHFFDAFEVPLDFLRDILGNPKFRVVELFSKASQTLNLCQHFLNTWIRHLDVIFPSFFWNRAIKAIFQPLADSMKRTAQFFRKGLKNFNSDDVSDYFGNLIAKIGSNRSFVVVHGYFSRVYLIVHCEVSICSVVPLVPKAGGGDPVVLSSCRPWSFAGEGRPGGRCNARRLARRARPTSGGAERSELRRAPARRMPREAPSPGDAPSQKLWSRRFQKALPSRFVRGPGKPDQEARRKDVQMHAPCLPAVLISKFSRFRTIDGLQRSKSIGA